MGNLRFLKAFVIDPTSSKLITGTGIKPPALTLGQVGIFQVDQNGITVGGSGAAPAPATIRRLKVAQNVGDSLFGTVRTQIIDIDRVVSWRGIAALAPATQITYIGWDEVDGTKDIVANCNIDLVIPIHIWEKKLATWYGPIGFSRNITINSGCCPDCGSPCTAADKAFIANLIATEINSSNAPAGDIVPGNELMTYLVATVVTNGLTGAALRVGVKIETILPNQDAEPSLNSCDPQKWWEFENYSFTVGNVNNGICTGTSLIVTTTQVANQGQGWAAGVAALEAESQGFDRVRDPLTQWPYSNNNGYKIFAVAGTKYDYYILGFDFKHRTGGGIEPYITEPYEIVFAVPTTTGATLQTVFNTWLAGKFTAVVL